MIRRIHLLVLAASSLAALVVGNSTSYAQKKYWADRVIATNDFLRAKMWNANTGNFIRRADAVGSPGSDAWGITIMLDAYAYMVENAEMKPDDLKRYYLSSTGLYEKTDGAYGARILARQGAEVYIGGDDDLQWIAALAHCFVATHDSEYIMQARFAFNALIAKGFFIVGTSSGWAWNSSERRPNGVSTAYGALAAARLYQITGLVVYRDWARASLDALNTPQVGFFPRDMMVAANAALTVFEASKDNSFLVRAESLASLAQKQVEEIIAGKRTGELNPTDVGDLAEGFDRLANITKNSGYKKEALRLLKFFVGNRTPEDIREHGFYSRYLSSGKPDLTGNYLGVPLSVGYLPEVAEMLKLLAMAETRH